MKRPDIIDYSKVRETETGTISRIRDGRVRLYSKDLDKYIDHLESQSKTLIEAFFKYLCNDADVIIEAFEDFDPENVNNIIENFFFELKTNKK